MPAPSAAAAAALAAEAVTVNQVDPEKAKQLTQAVAEQVRLLADAKCYRLAIPSEPDSHFFILRLCKLVGFFFNYFFPPFIKILVRNDKTDDTFCCKPMRSLKIARSEKIFCPLKLTAFNFKRCFKWLSVQLWLCGCLFF